MQPQELAKKVRHIQLQSNRLVSSGLSGAYLSVFKGRGIEFDEARPYVPGDDIRDIDWNVTARVGEPYIKRYVEERELTVMLVIDTAASLEFGSDQKSKHEAVTEFAALVAFSAIYNGDKVGVLILRQDSETYIPPRKGQKHGLRIVRELLVPPSSVATEGLAGFVKRALGALKKRRQLASRRSISDGIVFCRQVLRRRSVMFVLSDFIDVEGSKALQSAKKKHDVIAVRVEDPVEKQLPAAGLVALTDPQTGRSRLVDATSKRFRKEFEALRARRISEFESLMRSSKIDTVAVETDKQVVDALLEFLFRRARRSGR